MENQCMAEQEPASGKYYISTITALLIWSTSFIATKIAYATFPPITLGALRFVIASAVLGVASLTSRKHARPSFRDMRTLFLSGFLGITLYFVMENTGVKMTSASNAALIVAAYPAITALLELFVYKKKPTVLKIIGILCAIGGVCLLTYAKSGNGRAQIVGNLVLIATGFVWAFYNFTTQKIINRYPAITVSFYQTVSGTVCFLPLALLERDKWQAPTALSLSMLMYLGVFCSVVAFLLYNFGLRRLSAGTAVSLMNLVPVFGVLLSVLILNEAVTARQISGGIVVLLGVFLSVRKNS